MRIAIVADRLLHNGAGLMALAQAQLLAESDAHEVTLHSACSESSVADRAFNHRTFTGIDTILDNQLSPVEGLQIRRAFRMWLVTGLQATAPEVVVTHNVGRVLDQVQVAQLSRSVPVGAVLHDQWFMRDAHYTFEHQGSDRHEYEPTRAKGPAHSFDHLAMVSPSAGRLVGIAPSRWLREDWIATYPALPCVHLHNYVDPSVFSLGVRSEARKRLGIASDALVVGFVGGPNHIRKGFARLALAIKQILQQRSNVMVLAVGGSQSWVGTNASHILTPDSIFSVVLGRRPALGVPASISANTIAVGNIDRTLMGDAYAAMNVLVHPSAIDNLPTVPIESGFVGTRCLATNVGGTEESIADQKDLLSPQIGPTALALAISRALTDSVNETATERRVRRDSQLGNFDPKHQRPQLEAVLNWITGKVA